MRVARDRAYALWEIYLKLSGEGPRAAEEAGRALQGAVVDLRAAMESRVGHESQETLDRDAAAVNGVRGYLQLPYGK